MATVHDLVGLNTCAVSGMPIAGNVTHFQRFLDAITPLSIAGSRHSQGGQTVRTGGNVVLTEAMNSVVYNVDGTVTADAGATWNNIHHVLSPLGLSVPVQQSSPYFTVGGSISVNCHGRDPRQSPLIDSIVSLDVVLADGSLLTSVASTGLHAALFAAVVGGYGACGFISKATLKTCEDSLLSRQYTYCHSLAEYLALLDKRDTDNSHPQLHHAMLNFSQPQGLLGQAVDKVSDVLGDVVDTLTGATPAADTIKPDFFVDLFCVDSSSNPNPCQ
jgi:hypothetical protein